MTTIAKSKVPNAVLKFGQVIATHTEGRNYLVRCDADTYIEVFYEDYIDEPVVGYRVHKSAFGIYTMVTPTGVGLLPVGVFANMPIVGDGTHFYKCGANYETWHTGEYKFETFEAALLWVFSTQLHKDFEIEGKFVPYTGE